MPCLAMLVRQPGLPSGERGNSPRGVVESWVAQRGIIARNRHTLLSVSWASGQSLDRQDDFPANSEAPDARRAAEPRASRTGKPEPPGT